MSMMVPDAALHTPEAEKNRLEASEEENMASLFDGLGSIVSARTLMSHVAWA